MPEPTLAFQPSRIADQAAEALPEGIHRGPWDKFLPGEFELARRLGISRTSVHAATPSRTAALPRANASITTPTPNCAGRSTSSINGSSSEPPEKRGRNDPRMTDRLSLPSALAQPDPHR